MHTKTVTDARRQKVDPNAYYSRAGGQSHEAAGGSGS
jgi:hypothetical protein